MTFFYDLNKKLNDLAARQSLNEGKSSKPDFLDLDKDGNKAEPMKKAAKEKKVEESMDEGSTGDYSAKKARAGKDIGKPGKAFAKIAKSAGEKYGSKERGEKVAGAVLAKLRGKNESVAQEGNAFSKAVVNAKKDGIQPGEKIKVGGKAYPVKESHGDVGQILGKMANDVNQFKQTGELSDNLYNALYDCWMDEMPYGTAKARTGDPYQWIAQRLEQEVGMSEGVDKQKFAALAPPKDKITFADKIAGAKKEVDEMLGDVAAEAMKSAIGKMGTNSHQAKTTMKHIPNASSALKKAAKDIKPGIAGYRDRADMLRAGGIEEEEDLNPFTNWKKPRAEKPKVGSVERGALHDIEHTATGRKVTRRVDPNTGHSVGTDDDKPAAGEKRGRGRPAGKGAGKSIGAKGPSGKSKLMTKESEVSTGNLQKMHQLATGLKTYIQDEDGKVALKELVGLIKHYVSQGGEQELDEKAVSKKQQKFMGMVHAAQKGEKPASKEVAKVAKTMKKSDAEDFASTKHKDLPEKKKSKKKEDVEETTTAGSVATAPSSGKSKGIFGKSVYENKLAESFNNKLSTVLSEGMSINMSVGEDGTKSLTVNATDDDAVQLAQLLKMAGLGGEGGNEACTTCGESDCGCEQMAEGELANSPEPEYSDTDTMVNTLSGGLNGRKDTGQTIGAPFNRQVARQGTGIAETKEAELWNLYARYTK